MKALEFVAEVDEQHRLHLELPNMAPGPVRVLILLPEAPEEAPEAQRGSRGRLDESYRARMARRADRLARRHLYSGRRGTYRCSEVKSRRISPQCSRPFC